MDIAKEKNEDVMRVLDSVGKGMLHGLASMQMVVKIAATTRPEIAKVPFCWK
jgi:hypothetical protein